MAGDTTKTTKNTGDPSPEDLESLNGLADEAADDAELWNEFDDEEEVTASTGDGDDESSEESDDFDTAAQDADDDDDDDEPAPGSADQRDSQPVASGSDGQPSDHNVGVSDLFANATPEQKAAFEAASEKLRKLEQSDRSQRGRVSALQRRLEELQRAQPQAASSATHQPNDEGPDSEFLGSDDWKSFQDEYPEVAGPIGGIIGKLQAQLADQGKRLSAIGEERVTEALEEQRELLAREHSDWEDVVRDEGFQPWLAEQPRHIQEAVARNAQDIVDAMEAADVVGRYKASQPDRFGNSQQGGSSSGDPQGNGSGRRARQARSARGGRPTGGPGVASGIPEDGDEQAIWNAFEKQEQAARRRA